MLGIFSFKFSANEFETELSAYGGLVLVDADEQVCLTARGKGRKETSPRVISLPDCSHRLAESSGGEVLLARELNDESFRCRAIFRAQDLKVVHVQGCVLHPRLDGVADRLMGNQFL
eukprot:8695479-Pyramimonas_sp.AAC.1